MYTIESYSCDDTLNIAACLGEKLKGGELIALEGELGAGKTLFVKGLAKGLGVDEPVTSPTFTLIHHYEGRITLNHFDVYRLPSPESIEELGYEEFFYGQGVTAVEWCDLIQSFLPQTYLHVKINREYRLKKGEVRLITFIPYGKEMEELLEAVMKDDCLRN